MTKVTISYKDDAERDKIVAALKKGTTIKKIIGGKKRKNEEFNSIRIFIE
ncbi:hypothetical protein AB2T85_05555 [Clostridium butyricum]